MDSKPAKPVDGFAAFSVERLASLSDGVFAVAMTLLAYNIHIPIGPLNEAGLRGALARMVPAVMALVLSFFAAVMFWMGHQRLLGMMRQSGRIIYPPSFILLLLIILLPISTNLYGTFGNDALNCSALQR
ncbi:MAG TPA: TMEM175 family protein [Chthoniobacterales bacterium]|nr:TMEM175 family protein [Chthoniobacterales bacterium]